MPVIPESTKTSLAQRLHAHARTNTKGNDIKRASSATTEDVLALYREVVSWDSMERHRLRALRGR